MEAKNPQIQQRSSTVSPEEPSINSSEDPSKLLEGEYDANLEVLGDIHESDLEGYKENLKSKYSEESPDAILATGDLITNTDIRKNVETKDPRQTKEEFEYTVDLLDEIGKEANAPVYVVPGNHDPIKGAHPNNEEYISKMEDLYDDEIEQSIFEDVIKEKENVNNLEYGLTEINGTSIIGGSHFYNPEADPAKIPDPEIDDLYEEDDLEKVSEILEEQNSKQYGSLGNFLSSIPLIGSAWDYVAENFLDYGTESISTDEITLDDIENLSQGMKKELMSEEHEEYLNSIEEVTKDYNEKYDKMTSLLEEAGDDVIILDHFTFDTQGQSDLDVLGQENKGSPALRDAIQEYNDEKNISMFFGHKHSKGHEEVMGVDSYRLGEGNYMEAGINNGVVEDHAWYDSTEWSSQPQPQPQQQQPSRPTPQQQQSQAQQQQPSRQEIILEDLRKMEELGGPEELANQTEENVEKVLEMNGASPEQIERQKKKRKQKLETIWNNRENIKQNANMMA